MSQTGQWETSYPPYVFVSPQKSPLIHCDHGYLRHPVWSNDLVGNDKFVFIIAYSIMLFQIWQTFRISSLYRIALYRTFDLVLSSCFFLVSLKIRLLLFHKAAAMIRHITMGIRNVSLFLNLLCFWKRFFKLRLPLSDSCHDSCQWKHYRQQNNSYDHT